MFYSELHSALLIILITVGAIIYGLIGTVIEAVIERKTGCYANGMNPISVAIWFVWPIIAAFWIVDHGCKALGNFLWDVRVKIQHVVDRFV